MIFIKNIFVIITLISAVMIYFRAISQLQIKNVQADNYQLWLLRLNRNLRKTDPQKSARLVLISRVITTL